MDITKLSTAKIADEGFTFALRHPETGEELDVRFTVLGADSDVYRDKHNELVRRHQKEMAKRNRFRPITPEEDEAAETEKLVVATVAWENMERDGKPYPFSAENARALYSDRGLSWIRTQVVTAIHDRANFLPSAAKS